MKELPTPTLPQTSLLDFRLGLGMLVPKVRRQPPMPVARPSPSITAVESAASPDFEVTWARHADEVRAAQRLRHDVFVDEMGARLNVPTGTPPGHDADLFDDFCEHLLVRTLPHGDTPAQVIGTYRVLTPAAARRAGGYYSDTEFDLTRLRPLRERMAELGRSCVHPDHRAGGVILALWGALAAFMKDNGLDTVVGCASIGMRDGGHTAASLWARLREAHLAGVEYQVRPRLPSCETCRLRRWSRRAT